jgi:hypothetical protein
MSATTQTLHPSSRKLRAKPEAIRDLGERVEHYLTRSRIGALLAVGSHRSDRDDGWKDGLGGMRAR